MERIKGVRALSSKAEWAWVSRLSHTPACSMLLRLHKLPHNYPGGTPREERQAREGESNRGKSRTGCWADHHQEVQRPGPDVGPPVTKTQMVTVSRKLSSIKQEKRLSYDMSIHPQNFIQIHSIIVDLCLVIKKKIIKQKHWSEKSTNISVGSGKYIYIYFK